MAIVNVYTDNGKSIFNLTMVGKRTDGWEFVSSVKGCAYCDVLTKLNKQGYRYMTCAKARNRYGDLPEEE